MVHESFDPSMNILHRRAGPLDAIFRPKVVAVVGATETENSVGKTLMHNLLSASFQGKVIPVNPKRKEILGVKAYPNLKSIEDKIDLVVIVIPAKAVFSVIQEAAELNIPSAVIISAGFKEMGKEGEALEQQILQVARSKKMRIIGPNCLGVMNPTVGLNATFAAGMAHEGKIAFISQSGALCTAVLDWSLREKVGFSAFVSIGSMVDVNWGDLIDYFGSDPATESILIYMESVGDARSFLSAARQVCLSKPIILIKAGRSAESAKAAASHTGSLAGSDEAFSAALKRVGILRVDTIADLFSMTEALAKQPRPKGPKLMIVTNAGGPGVIATDALIANGGKLSTLSEESLKLLNQILPAPWSHNNPVDILGDAGAETYAKTIEIVSKDPQTDGILVILTPQDMTDPKATAEKLIAYAHTEKPILASWMGADTVQAGDEILTHASIPSFEFPDAACKAFANMWQYTYHLQGIYETPIRSQFDLSSKERHQKMKEIFDQAKQENRTLLDEVESKKVLEIYDIPCTPTRAAKTESEAAAIAFQIGFPVVLKVYSKTITHKTDVGGVKLNLASEEAVKKAYREIQESVEKKVGRSSFEGVTVQPMISLKGYEIILGSTVDPQFGPVVLFGAGGELVEVFQDRSLAIPPLTTTLARRAMQETKIYKALQGVRGKKAVDLKRLEEIFVRFSELVVDHPRIQEFDINPLLVSAEELIAVDARIILHPFDVKEEDLPQSAIRPYPVEYVEKWQLSDGSFVTIRPIQPEDEPLMVEFHKSLSSETVRQRYLKVLHYDERVAHDRLLRICFNDYDREIALIVEKEKEILAVIRLSKILESQSAYFSLIVKDGWQNKKIGSKLMEKILEIGKKEGIKEIEAQMLGENFQMQKLCKRFGFTLSSKEGFSYAKKYLDKL